MLSILTLFGHSPDNVALLYSELHTHVDRWVFVVDHGMVAPSGATVVQACPGVVYDFGALRNQGLAELKECPWVLHLDSDEWFSALQLSALVALLRGAPDEVDCVKLPRRNVQIGRDWVGWPDERPCVHRGDRGIAWSGKVEEWPQGVKKMVTAADASMAILHLQLDTAARDVANAARASAMSGSKLEQDHA